MNRKILILGFIAILLIFTTACSRKQVAENIVDDTMKITSPAFKHNGFIPKKYTCDGEDVNPELHIVGMPENAKSLVLIMDDPDAPRGTFVHWVVHNIDPKTSVIREGTNPGPTGITDFGRTGYGGPCPPSGKHRYFFKAYALDTLLNISNSSDKAKLESAMQGHIIAQAELIGLYGR